MMMPRIPPTPPQTIFNGERGSAFEDRVHMIAERPCYEKGTETKGSCRKNFEAWDNQEKTDSKIGS